LQIDNEGPRFIYDTIRTYSHSIRLRNIDQTSKHPKQLRYMSTSEEVQELIKELERLNLRQQNILRRLIPETDRSTLQEHSTEQSTDTGSSGERQHKAERQSRPIPTQRTDTEEDNRHCGLQIGDLVEFKSTATTRGGIGTIVRFTATRAVVKRPNGAQVTRAPRNLTKQQS